MPGILHKQVGATIRRIRIERGETLEVISSKLAISAPALSKIEIGITDVNLSRLIDIASVLEVTLWELLSETPQIIIETEETLLAKTLSKREQELIHLRQKVIALYEAIIETSKAKT